MFPSFGVISIGGFALVFATSAPLASFANAQQPTAYRFVCAESVTDQSSPMNCLTASTVPALGSLYPISADWFVNIDGAVGLGTHPDDPTARLETRGKIDDLNPLAGVVSVAAGGTHVVGTGTSFDAEINAGAAIDIAGFVATVLYRENDTSLYIDQSHPTGASGVAAFKDGSLFALTNAAGTDVVRVDENWFHVPYKSVLIGRGGDPQPSRLNIVSSDIAIEIACRNPLSGNRAEPLYSTLKKDELQAGDRNQITLGFFANPGGGDTDSRFFTYYEAVVEDPESETKSAALRFMTPSAGNTQPSERLRITGNGNVGIGTATPSRRLEVAGDALVTGNLHVDGTITKGSGTFRIDHPLDPANKYLSHSFVESPDMMNVYNGNVVLGVDGAAWIELPGWFEALNRDFRYHLTCIGGFAPVYIAEEISDNQFRVAGGREGLKVSWQVTGIRHDRFADAHRVVVEEEKPADERGTYLHPELFTDTAESGPDAATGAAHR